MLLPKELCYTKTSKTNIHNTEEALFLVLPQNQNEVKPMKMFLSELWSWKRVGFVSNRIRVGEQIRPGIGHWWGFQQPLAHVDEIQIPVNCQGRVNLGSVSDKQDVEVMWLSHKQTRNTGLGETKRLWWERHFFRETRQILLPSPLMVQHTNSAHIQHPCSIISTDNLLSRAAYCKSGRRASILFNPERLYRKEGSKGNRPGSGEGQTSAIEGTSCKTNRP